MMTAGQRRVLAAALTSVLPADDSGPGAAEAGGVDFIESAIRRGYCARHVSRVLDGLPLLDDLAHALWGREFAACDAEAREVVLRRLSDTPHPRALRFMASLVRLALAGFLSDPRHGGNRNGCGWAYVGFEPHARTGDPRPVERA